MAYQPVGAYFDSSGPTYATRAGSLTGITVDGDQGVISLWMRLSRLTTREFIFNSDGIPQFGIVKWEDDRIRLNCRNAAGTILLQTQTSQISDTTNWKHYLWAWDLSTGAADCYVDGSDDTAINIGPTAGSIDYTRGDWSIAALVNGSSQFDGDLAQLYVNLEEYVDITQASNRAKFYDATNSASVDLGSDGSTPTGTSPVVFHDSAIASWHTNDGTGGGFTENGTIAASSSNPPAAATASDVGFRPALFPIAQKRSTLLRM